MKRSVLPLLVIAGLLGLSLAAHAAVEVGDEVFVMNADDTGQRNISWSRFDDVATSWR